MNDRPAALFLGGMVIGMVVLALTWFIGSDVHGSSPPATHEPTQRTGDTASASAGQPQASKPDLMQRCSDAAKALSAPLRRADTSVEQWEIHVGAMNKLVVGAITLPQANAFWNQTRVGAQHKIDKFDQASSSLRSQGVDCPAPELLPARSSARLRQCAQKVAADVRVLQAAQTAIGTWHHHVQDMEMLRSGRMSPTTATRMWLAMWHRGQDEIDTYRAAARTAHAMPGCEPAASALASPSS